MTSAGKFEWHDILLIVPLICILICIVAIIGGIALGPTQKAGAACVQPLETYP